MNTGQRSDFGGPCSWGPGSRAAPAPRNDVFSRRNLVLHQGARGRAIFETIAAASAFQFLHLVEMPRLQQHWPDGRFGADLAAEATGVADGVVDPHLHRRA